MKGRSTSTPEPSAWAAGRADDIVGHSPLCEEGFAAQLGTGVGRGSELKTTDYRSPRVHGGAMPQGRSGPQALGCLPVGSFSDSGAGD